MKQDSGNVGGAMDRNASYGRYHVPFLDSRLSGRGVGDHMPSYDTLLRIQPSHTIIWKDKT